MSNIIFQFRKMMGYIMIVYTCYPLESDECKKMIEALVKNFPSYPILPIYDSSITGIKIEFP